MARSHTPEGTHTNPDVRFERQDINLSTVIWAGVLMSTTVLVLSAATLWFGRLLARYEDQRKKTTLPEAAADENRLPPQPRLEALEELHEGKVVLRPNRAQTYAHLPAEMRGQIQEAMAQLAGRLPAQKQPAPASYQVPLPSKSSSGRVETGGK
jgi:hypothetical protein